MILQDIIDFAADPMNRQALVFSTSTLFASVRTFMYESDKKQSISDLVQLGREPEYGEPLHREIVLNHEYNKGALLMSVLVPAYAGQRLAQLTDKPITDSHLLEASANLFSSFAGFCVGTVLAGCILKTVGFYTKGR